MISIPLYNVARYPVYSMLKSNEDIHCKSKLRLLFATFFFQMFEFIMPVTKLHLYYNCKLELLEFICNQMLVLTTSIDLSSTVVIFSAARFSIHRYIVTSISACLLFSAFPGGSVTHSRLIKRDIGITAFQLLPYVLVKRRFHVSGLFITCKT